MGKKEYMKAYNKAYYLKYREEKALYNKEHQLVYQATNKRWNKNHPKEYKAHLAVNNAVVAGNLVRPVVCSNCGQGGRIEGHHEDYNKPLEIVWLCTQCHRNRHEEIKEAL
jgi:hypothetical protein